MEKLLISLRLLNRLDGTWTLHLNKSGTPPHSIFLRPPHRLLINPCLLFSLDSRKFGNLCWLAVKGRRRLGGLGSITTAFFLPGSPSSSHPARAASTPLFSTSNTICNLVFFPLAVWLWFRCIQNNTCVVIALLNSNKTALQQHCKASEVQVEPCSQSSTKTPWIWTFN